MTTSSPALFGRVYSLRIGRPPGSQKSITVAGRNFETKSLFRASINPKFLTEEGFIEINDLQIKANIIYGKSSSGKSNSVSTIEIPGISKDTADFIKEGDTVLLSGGYEQDEDIPRIFTGEVITKIVVEDKAGRIVKLVVGQSFTALRDVRVSRSWPPNSSLYNVITDLMGDAKDSGLDFGSQRIIDLLETQLKAKTLPTGFSVEGNLFAVLSKVFNNPNLGWRYYFFQSTIYIEPKDAPPTVETFILEENNIRKSFESIETQTKKQFGKGRATGYKVSLFLDGRVNLNSALEVTFGSFKGTYKITAIAHIMDFEGSDWITEVLCQREEQSDAARSA